MKTSPGYIDTEMVLAVPGKVLESIIAQIPVGRSGRRSFDHAPRLRLKQEVTSVMRIYGANQPVTPWAKNHEDRGPV